MAESASLIAQPFSSAERTALERQEAIIRQAATTFYAAVGTALATIRDGGLYRATHATFEDYCRERWGMDRTYAHRVMAASVVHRNLLPVGNILPETERQTRPLAALKDPEQQREAWREAVETAPDGKVTALHVERVVARYRPAPEPPGASASTETPAPNAPVVVPVEVTEATPPPTSPLAVHFSSATPEWYTPPIIVARVLDFFDEIDLDPCSNSRETPNVPATRHFTKADDGLSRRWSGRVYMNPPYGREIGQWVSKLCDEYERRNIEAGIALLPARTDTDWFRRLRDYALCFIDGRLTFIGAANAAPFPSLLAYVGDEVARYAEVMADLGDVWRRVR